MTRQEIDFLRAAGYSIAEIMAMQPAQNAEPDPAGSQAQDQQSAQPAAPAPEPAPQAQPAAPTPAPAPAQPAPLPDNNPQMTELLTKILAAVQAGNRSAASQPTPEKLSPEEIAGKLY